MPTPQSFQIATGTATTRFIVYSGSSMYPTLQEPELLEIVPTDDQPVQVGDVIFFALPGENRFIVHRVVRLSSQGIRTRGDNSTVDDPWFLQPADILGRVIAAWHGVKRREIAGGRPGQVKTHYTHWRQRCDRWVSFIAGPLYRSLSGCSLLTRWLPGGLRPRVVVFQKGERYQVCMIWRGRLVGWYNANSNEWIIRRPFRLLAQLNDLNSISDEMHT